MKRSVLLGAAFLAMVSFTASPAEAATLKITPKVWFVETSDMVQHRVELAQTFTACASNPVHTIRLKVLVRNAHKGRTIREVWLLNGVKQAAFTDHWPISGDFTFSFGLTANNNFADGVWKLKLVKTGTVLAHSRVTLQTDQGC